MWGSANYVFVINADGTGNGYYDMGNGQTTFDITAILYIGDDITIKTITTGMYGGDEKDVTFAYAETDGNKTLTTEEGMMWGTLVLAPFEGEPDFGDDDAGDVDYTTVIVAGPNTLYFSSDGVTANTADRTVTITVAGEYKFRAGALWVKSIVDANGTLCETEDVRLTFSVEGVAELLSTDAGDQREVESFARPDKKSLGGKLVACIRSVEGITGQIKVICTGDGLESGEITFESV
jgi:hypothetical protein